MLGSLGKPLAQPLRTPAKAPLESRAPELSPGAGIVPRENVVNLRGTEQRERPAGDTELAASRKLAAGMTVEGKIQPSIGGVVRERRGTLPREEIVVHHPGQVDSILCAEVEPEVVPRVDFQKVV